MIWTGPTDLLVFFASRKIIWFHLSSMAYLMRPNARYCFSINNNLKKYIDVWEGFCGFLGHRKEVNEPMYPILCLLEDSLSDSLPVTKENIIYRFGVTDTEGGKDKFLGRTRLYCKVSDTRFLSGTRFDNDGASDECLEIHKHKAMSSKGNLFYPFFVEDVVVCSS